jgi:hypothetical protein
MSRSAWHTLVPVVLCALLFLVLPQTHLVNLFSKSIATFRQPLRFITEEGASNPDKRIVFWDPDVKVGTSNVAYSQSGAMCLLAEKQAAFFALFPPPRGTLTTMQLISYCLEDAHQSIRVSVPSQNRTVVVTEYDRVFSKSFNITDYIEPDQPFAIEIIPAVQTGKIVIEKLIVSQAPPALSPPPADMLIVFLIFLFFLTGTITGYYQKIFLGWLAAAGAASLFLAGLILELRALSSAWYWLVLLITIIGYRVWRLKAPSYEWFTAIFSVGLMERWHALLTVYPQPLGGDAVTYKSLTDALEWTQPLLTGIREPLYIWMQAVSLHVFGPNGYQFLLPVSMLSLGILYATYRLARTVSGSTTVGLLAAVFSAAHYAAVLMSARGERIELFTLLMLLYCLWIYRAPANSLLPEIGAGLIAGSICLCWLFGIAGVTALYFVRVFFKKVRMQYALAGLLFFALTLGPFLVSQWQRFGDPFHAVNIGANFYRNAEVAGSPSMEYGPGTWQAYVSSEVGLQKFISRMGAGYCDLFLNPENFFNKVLMGFPPETKHSYFFFPFYILGVLRELVKKRFWVPAMLLAFTNIFPYLLNEIYDFRLLCFLIPFFAYFWASGVDCVLENMGRVLRLKKNDNLQDCSSRCAGG